MIDRKSNYAIYRSTWTERLSFWDHSTIKHFLLPKTISKAATTAVKKIFESFGSVKNCHSAVREGHLAVENGHASVKNGNLAVGNCHPAVKGALLTVKTAIQLSKIAIPLSVTAIQLKYTDSPNLAGFKLQL